MKIALAQTKPVKGDIPANIATHIKMAATAAAEGAGIIVFPELSVTGYEPTLAKELAATLNDKRLDALQQDGKEHNIIICAGMPYKENDMADVYIGMFIFKPGEERQVYCKRYVHESEEPYFVNGKEQLFLDMNGHKLAPAICYEMSIVEHIDYAAAQRADIYLGSVAKDTGGLEKSERLMPEFMKMHGMTGLMANSVGQQHDFMAVGRSSVWNDKGGLVAQLDDSSEGMLIYNTESGKVITKQF